MPARNNHAFAFRPFSPKQLKLMYWYMDGSPYQSCDTIIADGAVRSGKTIAMICGFSAGASRRFRARRSFWRARPSAL